MFDRHTTRALSATLFALGNGRPPYGADPEKALQGHLFHRVPASQHLPDEIHAVLDKVKKTIPTT